jgi:hypothetical protein
MAIAIEPFLTGYDPSDLPGSSIDPLGFERGYLFLADRILPGLTNAASQPRYFSVLCAAIALSDRANRNSDETPNARFARRQTAVLRMERFWALACVLASDDAPPGIRGVRDAQRAARKLEEKRATDTAADFRLLARQIQYGLIGIYGNVAERLCFIDRESLSLQATFGEPLAEAFFRETDPPKVLKAAIVDGGSVKLGTLRAWGERAYVAAPFGDTESRLLSLAVEEDDTRKRMVNILKQVPPKDGEETELSRLRRAAETIKDREEEQDLYQAMQLILLYEECFQHCILVFYLMLFGANNAMPNALPLSVVREDPAIASSHERLVQQARALEAAFVNSVVAHQGEPERFREPLRFLNQLAATPNPLEFALTLLNRHQDVQHAKRDGGRPKMPWLEVTGDNIRPTLAVSPQVGSEPTSADDILPHFYRTGFVDNLRRGSARS